MTYSQWFEQIRGLDPNTDAARALIQQHPQYFEILVAGLRDALADLEIDQ